MPEGMGLICRTVGEGRKALFFIFFHGQFLSQLIPAQAKAAFYGAFRNGQLFRDLPDPQAPEIMLCQHFAVLLCHACDQAPEVFLFRQFRTGAYGL